jgi:hypothetical protein
MNIRLNPMHWSLTSHTQEGHTFTHEPSEVSDSAGKKLLQLRRNGIALFVVAEEEAPPESIFADEAKPEPRRSRAAKEEPEGDDPE